MLRRVDLNLVVITMIAAFMRLFRPGLYEAVFDEINLLYWAMRIARNGEVMLLSNNWVGLRVLDIPLTHHSPFANYLLSIPYLFTSDPRAGRVLLGIFSTVAVILVYLLTKRYFSKSAATIAGLLFAVTLSAVDVSRTVLNPGFALPFIAVWAFSGLLAFTEHRYRWAILHVFSLALIIQCQPAHAAIAPLSALLFTVAWWNSDRRGILMRNTAIGAVLFALALTPWMIGTYSGDTWRAKLMIPMNGPRSAALPNAESIQKTVQIYGRLVSSSGFISQRWINWTPFSLRDTPVANITPPPVLDNVFTIQLLLTVFGVVGFLVAWLNTRRVKWLFFALLSSLPISLTLFYHENMVPHHFYPLQIGAFVVQGVALAWLAKQHAVLRVAAGVLLVAIVVMQLWTAAVTWRWYDQYSWWLELMASMDTFRGLTEQWANADSSAETVYLMDSFETQFNYADAMTYFWRVMGEGTGVRFINRYFGGGVPLPADRTVNLISLSNGTTIPMLFGEGELFGQMSDAPILVFRRTTVDSFVPEWDYTPESIDRFSNGARILGAYRNPRSGGNLVIVWRVEGIPAETNYQFSVRIVERDERVLAQADTATLDPTAWRVGDTVLTPLALPNGDIPDDARLQVLMYTYPQMQNANVLDPSGNAVGQWLYLAPVSNPTF
jgi:4-amino-4-deoxy-L-arabinose transferase-like glycosyltransferase